MGTRTRNDEQARRRETAAGRRAGRRARGPRWIIGGAAVAVLAGASFASAPIAAADAAPAATAAHAGASATAVASKHVRRAKKHGKKHGKAKKGNATTKLTGSSKRSPLVVSNRARNGGAIQLSCRASAGTTRPPCARIVNSGSGSAFGFFFRGQLGGVFQIGSDINHPFPFARPFVTNATAVATGLNADRVDGMHAQDIINAAVDRSSRQIGAQGPQGPAGPPGPRGQQGPQGVQGPPGAPVTVQVAQTGGDAADPDTTVALPQVALGDPGPATAADGEALIDPLALDGGTYLVQVTFKAFNADDIDTAGDPRYGVATVFVDDDVRATLYTPDVPADGNNAAQATQSLVVDVPAGTTALLRVPAVVRTDTSVTVPTGESLAQGTASVVVTSLNVAR